MANNLETVTFIQACALLSVSPSRLTSLIGNGYLHPVGGNYEKLFRWEVEHLSVCNRLCKRRKANEVQFALPYD